jgi:hypothetical protein
MGLALGKSRVKFPFLVAALAGLTAADCLVIPAGAWAADDEDHVFAVTRTAPPGTATVWIDLDEPGLVPGSVAMAIDGQNGNVVLRQTSLGLSAVVAASPGRFALTVTAESLDAHISLTFADSSGAVLDGWDAPVVLPLGSGSSSSPSTSPTQQQTAQPTGPSPTESQSGTTPTGGSTVIPTDSQSGTGPTGGSTVIPTGSESGTGPTSGSAVSPTDGIVPSQ